MLSIVVPVYNVERYLKRCIESLLQQEYNDIEIVLVDDGSTDGSGGICDYYAKNDRRVIVFHKNNGGLPSAWSYGVERARGEFIGFVDSDDYCDSNYFLLLMEALTASNCDIVIGGYSRDYERSSRTYDTGSSTIKPGIYRDEQLLSIKRSIFEKPGTLFWARWLRIFKRELIMSNLKYVDKQLKVGEDMGIAIATFADAQGVVFVKNTGYHYMQRSTSMMHTVTKNELDNFMYLSENLKKISEEKVIPNYHCEVITQILVLIKKIAYCDLSRQEKYSLLKQIRCLEIVKEVSGKKDGSNRHFIWKHLIKRFMQWKFSSVLSLMALLKPIIK